MVSLARIHKYNWGSQNPHLYHEVPLHPMKVGVWCTVSARRIVVPVFFKKNN
jgi:hypothetical protein